VAIPGVAVEALAVHPTRTPRRRRTGSCSRHRQAATSVAATSNRYWRPATEPPVATNLSRPPPRSRHPCRRHQCHHQGADGSTGPRITGRSAALPARSGGRDAAIADAIGAVARATEVPLVPVSYR
jgi:hypothetical protein